MKDEKSGLTEFLDGIETDDQSQEGAEEKQEKVKSEAQDDNPSAGNDGLSRNTGDNDSDGRQPVKADSEQDSPQAEPEPEDINARLAKMEADNKRWEKRFKETQADWTRKNQELIEARKELDSLKGKVSAKADPKAGDDDDASYMTPKERKLLEQQAERLARIEERLEAEQKKASVREWEAKEKEFKAEADDYDEVVYEVFQPKWETDEALKKEFAEAGATPEAAYKIGKRIRDFEEMTKDPEAYKEKLKQQLRAELDGTSPPAKRRAGAKSLAQVPSKPPRGAPELDDGVLGEVLYDIQKRGN